MGRGVRVRFGVRVRRLFKKKHLLISRAWIFAMPSSGSLGSLFTMSCARLTRA